jgi:hypothetical protein
MKSIADTALVRFRTTSLLVERLLASARQLPQLRCLAFLNPWDLQSNDWPDLRSKSASVHADDLQVDRTRLGIPHELVETHEIDRRHRAGQVPRAGLGGERGKDLVDRAPCSREFSFGDGHDQDRKLGHLDLF